MDWWHCCRGEEKRQPSFCRRSALVFPACLHFAINRESPTSERGEEGIEGVDDVVVVVYEAERSHRKTRTDGWTAFLPTNLLCSLCLSPSLSLFSAGPSTHHGLFHCHKMTRGQLSESRSRHYANRVRINSDSVFSPTLDSVIGLRSRSWSNVRSRRGVMAVFNALYF